MSALFARFARTTARATGTAVAFFAAVIMVVAWAVTGPLFHFSQTWQLVINTSTTIVTFLMVFLIQNSQNRDSAAMQIKLDELIRAVEGARNSLIDLDENTDDEIDRRREALRALATATTASEDQSTVDEAQELIAEAAAADAKRPPRPHGPSGRPAAGA